MVSVMIAPASNAPGLEGRPPVGDGEQRVAERVHRDQRAHSGAPLARALRT